MSRSFFRHVVAVAQEPPRPWLTVSASSPLGRLLTWLRSDHATPETEQQELPR